MSPKITIGRGLFSNEPIEVPMECFEGEPAFFLTPTTQELFVKLEEHGIDPMNAEGAKASSDLAKAVFEGLVHGWSGLVDETGAEVPYTDQNRDKLAQVTPIFAEVLTAATGLAVRIEEDESGNSESSSGGTSGQVTS